MRELSVSPDRRGRGVCNLLRAVTKPLEQFFNGQLLAYANSWSFLCLPPFLTVSSFPPAAFLPHPSEVGKTLDLPDGVSAAAVCGNSCPWLGSCCSGGCGGAAAGLSGVAGAAGWDEGCARSSGGGTANTVGLEELDSLFISSTWMGPELLLRLIWYFFCPFCPCKDDVLSKLVFLRTWNCTRWWRLRSAVLVLNKKKKKNQNPTSQLLI